MLADYGNLNNNATTVPIMNRERSHSASPRLASVSLVVVLTLVGLLGSVEDAHAYLDPGTGSYVFQMVIAVLLSAAFTIKHFWYRLKGLVVRRDPEEPNDDASAS